MSMNRVVVRYHEVALKKNNRKMFVGQLTANILRALRDTGVERHHRAPGRIILHLPEPPPWPLVREHLRRVFGVANFLLCASGSRSLPELIPQVVAALDGHSFSSFAVRTKRCDKTYPIQSPEVSAQIGAVVARHSGARVDLEQPELEIHIEILPREVLYSFEKVRGPGGLPIASGGTALALLSGGIDSPVAAFRIMARGCRIEAVHFHGGPYQNRSSREKALRLAEVLCQWQPEMRLHLVPFGNVQRQIVAATARRSRIVLYRRMMVRIAQAIARTQGAAALVCGDSLGQVASQTLANIGTIDDAADMPILRPLIGMDKEEITLQARTLGTFPISIQPDEDCCQLFVPKHPATAMTAADARAAEAHLDIAALLAEALTASEVTEIERR
jgi:thiamine biosynthesis protein ThiI